MFDRRGHRADVTPKASTGSVRTDDAVAEIIVTDGVRDQQR
jgi:hypothetical protein